MCGIFGIISYSNDKRYLAELDHIKEMTANLLSTAQDRGTDASGICLVTPTKRAIVYKARMPGKDLPTSYGYIKLMQHLTFKTNFRCLFGHTRAQTKGTEYKNVNNHPIVADRVIGVHNGMISNDDDLFSINKDMERSGKVDSEVIFRLINKFVRDGISLSRAVRYTVKAILGSYACAFIHLDRPTYLTLFVGQLSNLVIHNFQKEKIMIFASTDAIISKAAEEVNTFKNPSNKLDIGKGTGVRINMTNGKLYTFELYNALLPQSNVLYMGFPPGCTLQ